MSKIRLDRAFSVLWAVFTLNVCVLGCISFETFVPLLGLIIRERASVFFSNILALTIQANRNLLQTQAPPR